MYEYKIIRSKRKTVAIQISEQGEIIVRAPCLCSEKRIKDFLEANRRWIDKSLLKQQERLQGKAELSQDDIKKLKSLAADVLPRKAQYFAELMGVRYGDIRITSAQKRFGSCNGKNNICFSYMLMLYPDEAVDYVVVHELAHTVQHNHSKAFYDVVASVMPDYKLREKLLKGKQQLPF